MAKKKRSRITAENQRAFDERTKMIESYLAQLNERIAARRAQAT
jgi:hypothetical protein